jgi:ELWxxDGT repeat protein
LNTFNNKIYFSANDWINWTGLWISDWTLNNSSLLKDFNVQWSSQFWDFVNYNNTIYFINGSGTYNSATFNIEYKILYYIDSSWVIKSYDIDTFWMTG